MEDKRAKTERNRAVIAQREAGKTYKAIALSFGISKARVEQIWKRHTGEWPLYYRDEFGISHRRKKE